MNSKVQEYVHTSLAAVGFCIIDPQVARELRPDIWATAMNAASDFIWPDIEKYLRTLPRLKIGEVWLAGDTRDDRWKPLAYRSMVNLDERIETIVGMPVAGHRDYKRGRTASELREIREEGTGSSEPIPSYPCAERTRRLAAAGVKDDPEFPNANRFAPRRAGL